MTLLERAEGEFEFIRYGVKEPHLIGPVTDVTTRVLERLRGNGWVRGHRVMGESMCLLGAYGQELYGRPEGYIDLNRVEALRQVIMEQFPGKYAKDDLFVVAKFNDDPDVTWDDVEKVLEKAAAKERESGSPNLGHLDSQDGNVRLPV